MGRMKDLDERLTHQDEMLEGLKEQNVVLQSQMGQMLHLMQDMVRLEGKIEKVEEKIDAQIKVLLDRVIEMSMVNQGSPGEANVHRAQSRLENSFSSPDSWASDEAVREDQWPPPDSDCMDI